MSRNRLKRVNAKVWINDNDFKFPEQIDGVYRHGSLGNFPHYRTFFQNAAVIDLNSLQVSALAHLSCWNVIENEDVIKDILG